MKMNELRAKAKELGLDMIHAETKEALQARVEAVTGQPVTQELPVTLDRFEELKAFFETKGAKFSIGEDYWQVDFNGRAESGNLSMSNLAIKTATNQTVFNRFAPLATNEDVKQ